MRRTSFAGIHCSLARSLEVIGDWWTPLILRDLYLGVTRATGGNRDARGPFLARQ
jgi:DNA-binding HxlR family transcriptional regulator